MGNNCCGPKPPVHRRRSSIDLAGLPRGAFLLKVSLHECERLRPADFAGSDPFVTMHLTSPSSDELPMGDQKQTSSYASGERDPRWVPAEIFSCACARGLRRCLCLVAPGQEISCLGARAVIVHDPSNTRLLMTVKNRDFLKKDSDVGDAYVKLTTLVDASGAALPKKANEELKLIDPRTGQQCGGGSIIRVGLELVSAHEARGEIEEHLCEPPPPPPPRPSSRRLKMPVG